jgi:hypothetical protein
VIHPYVNMKARDQEHQGDDQASTDIRPCSKTQHCPCETLAAWMSHPYIRNVH